MLYSSGYEAEIFEFMVKKLNCIPQEKDKWVKMKRYKKIMSEGITISHSITIRPASYSSIPKKTKK